MFGWFHTLTFFCRSDIFHTFWNRKHYNYSFYFTRTQMGRLRLHVSVAWFWPMRVGACHIFCIRSSNLSTRCDTVFAMRSLGADFYLFLHDGIWGCGVNGMVVWWRKYKMVIFCMYISLYLSTCICMDSSTDHYHHTQVFLDSIFDVVVRTHL